MNPVARHGGLSYLHVHAASAERCARFYDAVAGWAVESRANGGWRFASKDGLLIGGFGDDGSGARPGASFVPYVYVADVDAAVVVATTRGRAVVRAPCDEADLRLARVRDIEGNELGLWRFGDHTCSAWLMASNAARISASDASSSSCLNQTPPT